MCCVAWFEEEEEEKRGKRHKKAMEKMRWRNTRKGKVSRESESERMCDRAVGKDGGRETCRMRGWREKRNKTKRKLKQKSKRKRVTGDRKRRNLQMWNLLRGRLSSIS